ncbi:MAG: prolipoprotein diacylglyceryl transferase [Endomicrobium sp.]|jgi:phosphatidylglycerol:prolipoprotein diacylglycerol transferase|nr:prolipoprotein diacylglyceryl transferase [Endomicrobium sp.]
MYPILFSLKNFKIHTYGFFVALAFTISFLYLYYSIKKIKKKIISYDELYHIFVYIMISGIFCARLFFIILNLEYFILYPIDVLKIWNGGLVYYGGFVGSIIFIFIYTKSKKIDLFNLCDIFAPSLALGHAIGRIGCFFAGCCYGKATNLPWAITFTNEYSLAIKHVSVHPTQIYESIINFLLFIILHFYSNGYGYFGNNSIGSGMSVAIYLIVYGIARVVIEFFRGDTTKIYCTCFSISQIISFFLFIFGVLIIWKRKIYIKKSRKRE